MPWERGDVLCPAPLFKPASPRGRLILGRPEASSVGLPTGHEGKVQLDSVLKAVRGGLPKKPWPTWEEKLTLNRRAAMAKWEALVWKNKDSFEVARNVFRDSSAGRQADLSQALVDCFAGKASATLHSRVGPLLRYVHFLSREHSDPFPLDEGKLYMFMDRYCRYLPVVAPVLGVRSDPWGVVWHELLLKLGVTLREGWPLLPVPMLGGGYQQAPVSPEHAGRLLRELLRRELGDAESISALGTHSLKRTVLSWLAKYGLPREVRTILGYHSSDCGTEIVYARDTLSGPLRQMQEVLEAVTFGRFRPDATRSGYFASEKLARDREPQDELDSSSCGSDDEEAPDYAEDEGASDALARPFKGEPLTCDQANLIDYTILEEWHQRLMRARLQDVPLGYVRPSFKQLLRADQRLFAELQDRSRTGIQSDANGRPLDKLLPQVMDLTEVTMLMQPLPAPSASSFDVVEKPWVGKERLFPYGKFKDGKGKGKTKTKRTGVLPKALVGCYSCTASGENICYDFNINGCSRAVKNNRQSAGTGGNLCLHHDTKADCELDLFRAAYEPIRDAFISRRPLRTTHKIHIFKPESFGRRASPACKAVWPDVDLFSDIKSGFSLVGSAGVTGVFETSFKAAEFTEDELDSRAKFLRPALWGKIASSAASEFEDELWQKTLDERDKKG
ncbi:unnamed protein product [Symbiodinium microadriaticum]|nr:unnamed protein product [Symbiodinium microadriaticum]CAE7729303.1 unnamed protein product [Symbiodinium sp. KB8]